MSNESNYAILGVSEDSSWNVIKKAFHKLALQYHPDKNKNPDAEEQFKKILAAYKALGEKMIGGSSTKDDWENANPKNRRSETFSSSSSFTDSDSDDGGFYDGEFFDEDDDDEDD